MRRLLGLLLLLTGCLDLDPSHYRFTADEPSPSVDAGARDPTAGGLVALTISSGTLAFSPTVTEYDVAVPSATISVTLTPTAADPSAHIDVDGTPTPSGAASQALGLVDGAGSFDVVVTDGDAGVTTYRVRVTPRLPEQRARFEGVAHFGYDVALSGDTLAVGAWGDNANAGLVTIFVRQGGEWVQQQQLRASNANQMDQFGRAVALDGDTLVVGAPTEDSAAQTIDGDQADNTASNAGAAYVFVRAGTTWTQQAYLKPTNTAVELRFGTSVDVSGERVAVGARGGASAGASSGAAYLFTRSGATWAQEQHLTASNAAANALFGVSVALSGDTLVVGASGEATGGSQSGAAYVFVRGPTWTEQAMLKASDRAAYSLFGSAVDLDGDTAVVGAYGSGGSLNFHEGSAYVFVRSGAWREQARLAASARHDNDEFGWSVAVSGNTVAVGAWQDGSGATGVNGVSASAALNSGAGYLFFRSGEQWSQRAWLKSSVTTADDNLGASVALTPSFLALGGETQVCLFTNP